MDCDNDTLLLKVEQCGGSACHTGSRSCFFKEISLQKCVENVGSPSVCNTKNSVMQNFTAANSTLTNSAAERSEQNLAAASQNSTPKNSAEKSPYGILDEIYHVCLDRKLNGEPALSYVASLYAKGENAYLKKIAEEACEFALACKDLSRSGLYADVAREGFGEHRAGEPRYDVIYEGADLLFHLLLALAAHNIHPDALLDELARRQGQSGIEEKRRREK